MKILQDLSTMISSNFLKRIYNRCQIRNWLENTFKQINEKIGAIMFFFVYET